MLIGIVSDTHGKSDLMRQAVSILRQRGMQFLIHCGDVGSLAVVDQMAGIPSALVWGNGDFDRYTLERYAGRLGLQCLGSFGRLELDGKRVAVMHGDDNRMKQRVLNEQKDDYLLLGHTHLRLDERVGRIHVINPGAMHRANPKTVVMLDTVADAAEILNIETSLSEKTAT
jgi:uncharacterized protein